LGHSISVHENFLGEMGGGGGPKLSTGNIEAECRRKGKMKEKDKSLYNRSKQGKGFSDFLGVNDGGGERMTREWEEQIMTISCFRIEPGGGEGVSEGGKE